MYSFIARHFSARCALAALLCAALFLCGCVPASAPVETPGMAETPAPVSTPLPTPTPTPAPDYAALAALAKQVFAETYAVDISGIVLPEEMGTIPELMEQLDAFNAMCGTVEAAARTAYEAAYEAVSTHVPSLHVAEFQMDPPSWEYLMALYRPLGDGLGAALSEHYIVAAEMDELHLTISFSLQDYEAIIGEDSPALFGFKVLYAYFNTVYDSSGQEKEYTEEPLSDEYLAALTDPLPDSDIKDGWYGPRSQSTRKHTGTDIRARRDTPILSCTDGTVLHIGTGDIPGNYVVVRDDAGYEYHYYHMVRITDFLSEGDRVNAGDIVGHVGNTGNSDANHLHLTVITPEMTYINPYPMLYRMRELHKAAEAAAKAAN